MMHNPAVGWTILRKIPSQASSTSHGSRHSRPWIGLQKGQILTGTNSKYKNEAFKGKIERGGDLELQSRRMHGTNSAICSAISCGMYRPASFLNLTCEWLGYTCTLFSTGSRHVVYCTDCGGVSVLTSDFGARLLITDYTWENILSVVCVNSCGHDQITAQKMTKCHFWLIRKYFRKSENISKIPNFSQKIRKRFGRSENYFSSF